jgi:hypothetical protein
MKYIYLYLFLLLPLFLHAQYQTIRGSLHDAQTHNPIIGATIVILDLEETRGTTSNIDGNFILENVPVGQRTIEVSFLGYENFQFNNVLSSAKEWNLTIQLQPQSETLATTIVNPSNKPLNENLVVSARSITPEQAERFPVGANDPGRLALSFPGVQPSKDSENDIVVRGNNSIGLLWKLEGVDIPNPNHFARIGSSGGGITIFSSSVLGNSDFSGGAFPAEYGNALSGVFDMKFRKGNTQKREYTFRAGMLGLDFAAEGPFKGENNSYLFNYRYSTLGILNNLGIHLVGERVNNTFQDVSFNLAFEGKNKRSFTKFWGVGGLSQETETAKKFEERQVIRDSISREAKGDVGIIGLTHSRYFGKNSSWFSTMAIMGQNLTLKNHLNDRNGPELLINNQQFLNNRIVLSTKFKQPISKNIKLELGLSANLIFYDLQYDSTIVTDNTHRIIIAEKGNFTQWQSYAQVTLQPFPKWTFNLGFHGLYFALTNDFSINPRGSIVHQINKRQRLSFAYGRHTRTIPLGSYFALVNGAQPNRKLEMMKAHHFILGYDLVLSKGFQFRAETYYQRLFDIPVGESNGRSFYYLNRVEGYVDETLLSEGTGVNYGIDLTLEKSFQRGLFLLVNASLFESKYKGLTNQWHSTQFNSNFAASLTGGKEWEFKKVSFLQLGWKCIYNHGMPSTPLIDDTLPTERPPYDWSRPYSNRVDAYYRLDLRIAWRKNKPKSTFLIALDVQNMTSRINERAFGYSFSKKENRWERSNQAGLIPILSFRLDF